MLNSPVVLLTPSTSFWIKGILNFVVHFNFVQCLFLHSEYYLDVASQMNKDHQTSTSSKMFSLITVTVLFITVLIHISFLGGLLSQLHLSILWSLFLLVLPKYFINYSSSLFKTSLFPSICVPSRTAVLSLPPRIISFKLLY